MQRLFAELTELTLPTSGLSTMRALDAIFSRVLVRDFMSIPLGRVDARHAGLHRRTVDIARSLASKNAPRLVRALKHPTTQALCGAARRLATTVDASPMRQALFELDSNVLFELAADGALPEPVEIARVGAWPELRSIGANALVRVGAEVDRIVFSNGRLELFAEARAEALPLAPHVATTTPLFSSTSPYHALRPGLYLATTDNNPLADVQAHPERAGNRLDLGGREVPAWTSALDEALLLLEAHLPLVARELGTFVELVVPVGWSAERHFSCSFEEAVGAIYLTLHPNVMTLAEALVHEFQHNKLNAVLRVDPLVTDAPAAVHRSPLRPDPRPLRGVLMAVHAFEPVARLYENMTTAAHPLSKGRDWSRRFREILHNNHSGLGTVLEHAHPTPLGRTLFDELRRLDDYFANYERLQWPALVGNA